MVRFRTLLLATSALIPLGLAPAAANPLGAQVVGGSATVQGQGTASVTVTQTTNSAIINWNTFNIGAGEKTNIIMPGSTSVQLDRVTGGLGPSEILGSLTSNGRVFLVNPDGILFGAGATVNTSGFVATTHDIANADFMAGKYNFSVSGNPSASIVNLGTITASNTGFAALVAPGVRNSGTITATLGTVGLAASGNGFSLDLYGDKLITLNVNDQIAATVKDVATGQPLNSLVSNSGKLSANGGRVELTAAAARQVVDSVISNTGVIEANSIGSKNGMIVLSAATASSKPAGLPKQTVKVSGTLSTAGTASGTKGGTIQITAENIAVIGATIDASGDAGGGTVLIGGDVGGGKLNPLVASIPPAQLEANPVPTASTVSIDAATTINASALGSGDGGKVVVWADDTTSYRGNILARGGDVTGNGGFVEVSGHQTLNFYGATDTYAPAGLSGLTLLDPANFTVNSDNVGSIQSSLASGNFLISTVGTTGTSPGDIFVNAAMTWSSAFALTLQSAHDIAINSAITATNGGLVVNAQNAISATGAINLATFTLQNGAWNQVAASLPGFTATDFRIAGGTFLRALGGNGSAATPYQIADVYGLQGIGSFSGALLNQDFVLANDINASGTATWNGGAGFVPIGSFGQFTGQLDGQNRTISNLKIAPIATNISQIGLFGQIGAGGVVRNLTLSNVSVNANPGLGSGFQQVGALAGSNAGLIDNVAASGTVNGGTVSGLFAGGLVGLNGPFNQATGTIQNSSSAVAVTLGNGVACTFTGTSCNNDGRTNVAGGLVGVNTTTISSSSASGSVVVGANSQAGGLVGINQIQSGATTVAQPTIQQSFATGNVSSAGVNVALGGLVGYNGPGSWITLSRATGTVSATANLTANMGVDCSTGGCENASAGGLVGQNSGTIQGAAIVPSPAQACGAGQTCATGAVSVGSDAQGGGLVGFNDGIITNAFATGAVTGAAGLADLTSSGSSTSLGGLAASNQGLITGSHATGNVGTLGVANLQLGGLVADNGGTIANSFATGNVSAGNNSQAGGLTGNSGPWNNFSCTGCFQGDGFAYFNTGLISHSQASGNVSVGATSLAGGLSGTLNSTNINNTIISGTITNSTASGAVSAGGNSIIGGLVGVSDLYSTITSSTTASTSTVTATGSNSWVGGFVGANAGTISLSSAAGPVNSPGLLDSLVGGFAGLNVGLITDSTTAATSSVTATGANNYVGGFVGANFGTIDPSTSAGAVTGGANNFVGGFAGTNAALVVTPELTIPGSTFPVGTISSDSVGSGSTSGGPGSTINPQIGTTSPTSLPTNPSVVQGCKEGPLCALLQGGFTLVPPPPTSPDTPPVDPLPPPVTQIIPPIKDVVTTPPVVLASLVLPTGPVGAVSTTGPAATGPVPGKPSFIPPPLPSRPTAGPNGETSSSIPPLGERRFFQNQVLLQLELNVADSELNLIAQQLGVRIVTNETLSSLGRRVIRLELPAGLPVREAIRRLEANSLVSVAAPIYRFRLVQGAAVAASRGDPAQYVMGKLHLPQAHAIATGKGITIALIDSAVDKRHTELQGTIADELDTINVTEGLPSHGTEMAGAIVSRDRLLGVAPGAKIMTVRAFGEANNSAEGTSLSIVKGIDWAVSRGARVINMSFAGPRDPSLERALKMAHDKGVVLIAAAGNAGPKSPPLYPGADPHVIAVTATDARDQQFRGANQGTQLSIAAPGVDILAPAPAETYRMSTGTSIATAHVSGVVALMLERDPTMKPDDVRRILESTATDLGPKGKDSLYGWGLVDPPRALEAVGARLKSSDAAPKNR